MSFSDVAVYNATHKKFALTKLERINEDDLIVTYNNTPPVGTDITLMNHTVMLWGEIVLYVSFSGNYSCSGTVYKNGVEIATFRRSSGSAYDRYIDSIDVKPCDEIKIIASISGNASNIYASMKGSIVDNIDRFIVESGGD